MVYVDKNRTAQQNEIGLFEFSHWVSAVTQLHAFYKKVLYKKVVLDLPKPSSKRIRNFKTIFKLNQTVFTYMLSPLTELRILK